MSGNCTLVLFEGRNLDSLGKNLLVDELMGQAKASIRPSYEAALGCSCLNFTGCLTLIFNYSP